MQDFNQKLQQVFVATLANRVRQIEKENPSVLTLAKAYAANGAYGIKELSEFTEFVIKLANVADEQLADGFQAQDVFAILSLWQNAIQGLQGMKLIGFEIADMDTTEAAKYKSLFSKLNLRNDKAEQAVIIVAEEVVNIWFSIIRVRTAILEAKR